MYDQDSSPLGNAMKQVGGLTSAKRESEVNRELTKLSIGTETVLKLLAELENKLSPVLKSYPEEGVNTSERPQMNTPIGEELFRNNMLVTSAQARISQIIERLEV